MICPPCNSKRNRDRKRRREATDPAYKLKNKYYLRVRHVIRRIGASKSCRTNDLVGCSWGQLKIHLEQQFKKGMSWENYGREGWHVDHIIPLKGENVSGLHTPSNLRAMRGVENISKKNKFEVNYAQ